MDDKITQTEEMLGNTFVDYFLIGITLNDESTCFYRYGDGDVSQMNYNRLKRLLGEIEACKMQLMWNSDEDLEEEE